MATFQPLQGDNGEPTHARVQTRTLGGVKVNIFPTSERAAMGAAMEVLGRLAYDPASAIGFSPGETMRRVYASLYDLSSSSGSDWRQCRAVALAEYCGRQDGSVSSVAWELNNILFSRVHLSEGNRVVPERVSSEQGQSAALDFAAAIQSLGKIDLQLLEIGANGRLGFNEPGTALDSRVRVAQLSPATRAELEEAFRRNKTSVPESVITVGLADIRESSEIIVCAFGQDKALAVRSALMETPSIMCPASSLRNHPGVRIILDREAAALL